MALLTIADLQQPAEFRKQYIAQAMTLSGLWDQWSAQHDGNMDVGVIFRGERDRGAGVHASEVSGCMRKLVYSIAGEKRLVLAKDRDVNMQRRFNVGTMMHALIQAEFHAMSKWLNGSIIFEDEVKISPELGGIAAEWKMQSSCDGVFTFMHEGQPYMRVGLEIKTMSEGEFDKLKEPKDDHKDQTALYMRALDLPLMWTLYYNKSNSNTTKSEPPFLFQFNQPLWDNKLALRVASAIQMAEAGQLPAKEEGRPCGWCPYGHVCQPTYLNRSGRRSPSGATRDF